jgi:glutamyl-tRNA reductase
MALIIVGVNHRGASLEIRERLAYRPSEATDALAELRAGSGATEAVLLSTCNRTEAYLVESDVDAVPHVWRAFSQRLGSDASGYGYVRRDREAATHLFRVASGLDSMVLGEAQIHGQVREAWELCRAHSGPVLNRLFQTSLSVAGRVRNETAVGRGAASVSSASVQLSKQIFGSLNGKRAMVLGAGEMAELALESLTGQGVSAAIVANRTFDRAATLASKYGAVAMHYDECWAALADVDLLVCSTAAPRAVVLPEHVKPALAARGDRPLCILDIALPRDVDPAVGKLDNVFLYDLDDLQAVVTANLERRRAEVPSAEELITAAADKFWQWVVSLSVVPTLAELRAQMEALRLRELGGALRRLDQLSPSERAVVEDLTRTLMNKFLHSPSVRLRAAAAEGRDLSMADALRYLFDLDPAHDTTSEPVLANRETTE